MYMIDIKRFETDYYIKTEIYGFTANPKADEPDNRLTLKSFLMDFQASATLAPSTDEAPPEIA